MLLTLIAVGVVNLLLLIVLFLRKPAAPVADTRLIDGLTQTSATLQALEAQMRGGLGDLRRDQSDAARELRAEVGGNIEQLRSALTTQFDGFRTDNGKSSEVLRTSVAQDLEKIGRRLETFGDAAHRSQAESREALHSSLTSLGKAQTDQSERLREVVQQRIDKLNVDNAAKLEEMRATVDEKLHATLEKRLTDSFGLVTTHLGEVQKGLGEMKELATGVSDLKKVFSNVKSRGVVGEFMLGQLMEQMFSPEQYLVNASIKSGSLEKVEYALKVPVADDEMALLAIDSKFPQGDWERLEHAYESGEGVLEMGKAFERSIRAEGDRICKKYIDEPTTLPYAVMFLPTEALYAEVLRRAGLVSTLQQECRVMVAGPSTFMHIMANFRMGFRTIAVQKKGLDVLKVLGAAKKEFEAFGDLVGKASDQIGTVQKTLDKVRSKTTTINRALKNVDSEVAQIQSGPQQTMEDMVSSAPLLAAAAEEEF